jgi:2-polyprenyl-3-methyl-5-hydroxy-6-metoxy-1,4-benzoquinol methylase
MAAHAHTHDHIDWAARIPDLRRADELDAGAFASIAARLTAALRPGATVVDVGSGAGGMSAALAAALATSGGGTLLLVDAVPELLAVAAETAATGAWRAAAGAAAEEARRAAAGADADATDTGIVAGTVGAAVARPAAGLEADVTAGRAERADTRAEVAAVGATQARVSTGTVGGGDATVKVDTIHADVAAHPLGELVPSADLVWAAAMIHHLPDQQAGITGLASALSPGGVLAVAEGGLETQTLPWDLGVGEPGFERRLMAARDEWFAGMRASMDGVVRMPYGWTAALDKAGLADVSSFTVLLDHPAPVTASVREFVIAHIERLVETVEDLIGNEDRETAQRLLDPDSPDHLGNRDDLYVLGTRTIHFGRKR